MTLLMKASVTQVAMTIILLLLLLLLRLFEVLVEERDGCTDVGVAEGVALHVVEGPEAPVIHDKSVSAHPYWYMSWASTPSLDSYPQTSNPKAETLKPKP